jgi:hypothetical protein
MVGIDELRRRVEAIRLQPPRQQRSHSNRQGHCSNSLDHIRLTWITSPTRKPPSNFRMGTAAWFAASSPSLARSAPVIRGQTLHDFLSHYVVKRDPGLRAQGALHPGYEPQAIPYDRELL